MSERLTPTSTIAVHATGSPPVRLAGRAALMANRDARECLELLVSVASRERPRGDGPPAIDPDVVIGLLPPDVRAAVRTLMNTEQSS